MSDDQPFIETAPWVPSEERTGHAAICQHALADMLAARGLVAISRREFVAVIRLAEGYLRVGVEEYSSFPKDDDVESMRLAWKALGCERVEDLNRLTDPEAMEKLS